MGSKFHCSDKPDVNLRSRFSRAPPLFGSIYERLINCACDRNLCVSFTTVKTSVSVLSSCHFVYVPICASSTSKRDLRWFTAKPIIDGSVVKNPPASAGDVGSIPGSGRSPGGEHGNPFQYSCLENPMDGEAWWASVHGLTKSWTRLSMRARTPLYQRTVNDAA